jgi:hypothetical protein
MKRRSLPAAIGLSESRMRQGDGPPLNRRPSCQHTLELRD